ncbi:hypothetical protein FDG2_0926 [Candidatus Protofrankia californiensis]|uniref:Uncharacterized protein n=1 Tax=Candidatus Protofrankia californiensis TaxID=1839754 RepID=A0A1C3NUR3_9ACTN|nr:hypothetical protein FDG2_0926 [Candidatus Protofrankia californiensis]
MWVELEGKDDGYQEDLDLILTFLYADSQVLHSPQAALGYVLSSPSEVQAAQSIDTALRRIIDVGTTSSDAEVIAMPIWRDVVEAAKNALDVMRDEG